MHATQKPADGESDADGRIGLGLDELSECYFERACGLARRGRRDVSNLSGLLFCLADGAFKTLRLSCAWHDYPPISMMRTQLRRVTAAPTRRPIPSASAVVVWGLSSINLRRKSWPATAASLPAS